QKLDRRQAIATIMIEICEKKGDIKGLKFWYDVLEALDVLGVGGMSDEEEGNKGDKQVRHMKDLDFHHPDFHALFKKVDSTRSRESSIFNKKGRRHIQRVYVLKIVSHQPLSGLPSSYYQPAYLELMEQGDIAKVKVHHASHLLIPRHVFFIGC
ncbi:hypothetical protein BT96DRAFT_835156, partial [Gymnopus androsaceus JB14]